MKMMTMMSQMGTVKINKKAPGLLALAPHHATDVAVLTEIGELSWGDTIKGIIAVDLCSHLLPWPYPGSARGRGLAWGTLPDLSALILAVTLKIVQGDREFRH